MELMIEKNEKNEKNKKHNLNDTWMLWAHLPHDTNWSFSSYKKIMKIETIEDILCLYQNIPDILIKNCMLFLMRNNIQPIWEDPKNIKGGCFSYKINNKNVISSWKNLSYTLLGETLVDKSITNQVNGITISPKKNFGVIKIWLSSCDNQSSDIINPIEGLSNYGALFKKHISENT